MRTRRGSRTAIVLTAAAAGLCLIAGCSATTGGPTATRTVTATPASAPASGSTSPSPAVSEPPAVSPRPTSSAGGTTKVDPDAPAGQCPDSALQVSVQNDPEAAGLGQRGAFVVFRNTGSGSCRLDGTPGLSLVGSGDGTQIGAPAERSTSGAKPVMIRSGAAALAQVQYTYVDEHGGNFSDGKGHDPACEARPADGYRVYPPHSYRASFSPFRTYACSTDVHWISVSPVRPASDFPYFTPRA